MGVLGGGGVAIAAVGVEEGWKEAGGAGRDETVSQPESEEVRLACTGPTGPGEVDTGRRGAV